MRRKGKAIRILGIISIVFLIVLVTSAFAGIPEPGILLYGHVRDGAGALVTSGTLNWTFTPAAGGNAVTVTTDLRQIDGPGGPYSYAVMIPMETGVTGYPASANTISLSSSPVTYTRTAQVAGTGISFSDTLNISIAARGMVRCVPFGNADADGDGMPDAWEQTIVNANTNDSITSVCDVLPTGDFDQDGITNYDEYVRGTDPIAYNGPPTVVTGNAIGITDKAATLAGAVNPNGYATNYWFEYGLTTGYGSSTAPISAGSGTTDVAVTEPISGLTALSTYHFRIVAQSVAGTVYGTDNQFATSAQILLPERIGVFLSGLWYLDSNGSWQWDGTPTDTYGVFGIGLTGAIPVVGDWNGDGKTEIGVFIDGIWYLDMNGNWQWDGEPTDVMGVFGVGLTGAIPVTGDWNGDGITEIGVYQDGYWYLDTNRSWQWDGEPTDTLGVFGIGLTNAVPVTGDWNSDRTTEIGVYMDGYWYLDKNRSWQWDGEPTDTLGIFGIGLTNEVPVTGDWNGDGTTEIGVYMDGYWYLDKNRSWQWDGEPTDTLGIFGIGLNGEVPVTGKW